MVVRDDHARELDDGTLLGERATHPDGTPLGLRPRCSAMKNIVVEEIAVGPVVCSVPNCAHPARWSFPETQRMWMLRRATGGGCYTSCDSHLADVMRLVRRFEPAFADFNYEVAAILDSISEEHYGCCGAASFEDHLTNVEQGKCSREAFRAALERMARGE